MQAAAKLDVGSHSGGSPDVLMETRTNAKQGRGDRQPRGPAHSGKCACQSCQVKRACLRKVMTPSPRSPALFEMVEAWALEDPDNRN